MSPPLRIPCPKCGSSLRGEGLPVGKSVQCPKCSYKFRVPDPEPLTLDPLPLDPLPEPAPARAKSPLKLVAIVGGLLVAVGIAIAAGVHFLGGPGKPDDKGGEHAGNGSGGGGGPGGGGEPGGGGGPNGGGPGAGSGGGGDPGGQPAAGKPVDLARPVHLVGHRPEGIIGLAYSPDGSRLASITTGGEVILWNLNSGSGVILTAGNPGKNSGNFGRHVAFSPDGKTLYSGNLEGVTVWDVESASGKSTIGKVDTTSSEELALSPDSKHILTSIETPDGQGGLQVWDAASQNAVMKIDFGRDTFFGKVPLWFSPDGKTLALLLKRGQKANANATVIRVFDLEQRRELPAIQEPNGVELVFLSNNSIGVWTGQRNQNGFSIWDLGDRQGLAKLVSRKNKLDPEAAGPRYSTEGSFGLPPDRKTLVVPLVVPGESGLGLYDFPSLKRRASVAGSTSCAFTTDNRTIVALATTISSSSSGARPGTVTLVEADAATGQTRAVFEVRHPGPQLSGPNQLPELTRLVTPPNRSDVVAVAVPNGTIVIHPLHGAYPPALKEVANLPFDIQNRAADIFGYFLQFTDDGRHLVRLAPSGTLGQGANTIWDARTKKHLLTTDKVTKLKREASPSVLVLPEQDMVYSLGNGVGRYTLGTGALKEEEPYDLKKSNWCMEVRLAADGKTAAAHFAEVYNGQGANRFGLVDPVTMEMRQELLAKPGREPGRLQGIVFSPDGKLVVTHDKDGKLRLFELPSGRERPTTADGRGGFGPSRLDPAFVDGGALMVLLQSVGAQTQLSFYDVATGQKVRDVDINRGHNGDLANGGLGTVAVSPASPFCASVNKMGELLLHDLKSGDLLYRVQAHNKAAIVAISPDGKLIATAGSDGKLRFWEVGDVPAEKKFGQPQVVTLQAPPKPGSGSGAGSGEVTAPVEIAELPNELGGMYKSNDAVPLVLGPGGRFVGAHVAFSADRGAHVQFWDVAGKKRTRVADADKEYVHVTPDGRYVYNKVLEAFDLETGKEAPTSEEFVAPSCFAMHPDGKTVAVGIKGPDDAKEKLIRFVEFPSRKERRAALEVFGGEVTALAYSPDGKHLIANVRDKDGVHTLLWLNGDTGAVVSKLGFWEHNREETHIVFSGDGKTLAMAGEYGVNDVRVTIWDVASGKQKHTFKLESGCEAMAFVDGGRAIAVHIVGDVAVYDVATGRERHRTNFNATSESRIWYQRLCPARGLFISLRGRGEVIVWDLVNNRQVGKFEAHSSEIVGLAVSPDETHFATLGLDNKVKVWSLVGKGPK